MNIAGGIDLGGTKIEAQRFDHNWDIGEKRRIDTPKTYPELLSAMAVLITWLKGGDTPLPIGVATAGFAQSNHWGLDCRQPSKPWAKIPP